jgi:hypothetical protein
LFYFYYCFCPLNRYFYDKRSFCLVVTKYFYKVFNYPFNLYSMFK